MIRSKNKSCFIILEIAVDQTFNFTDPLIHIPKVISIQTKSNKIEL